MTVKHRLEFESIQREVEIAKKKKTYKNKTSTLLFKKMFLSFEILRDLNDQAVTVKIVKYEKEEKSRFFSVNSGVNTM